MKDKQKWTECECELIKSNLIDSKNEQTIILEKIAGILNRGVGGVMIKRDRISRSINFDEGLYTKVSIGGWKY